MFSESAVIACVIAETGGEAGLRGRNSVQKQLPGIMHPPADNVFHGGRSHLPVKQRVQLALGKVKTAAQIIQGDPFRHIPVNVGKNGRDLLSALVIRLNIRKDIGVGRAQQITGENAFRDGSHNDGPDRFRKTGQMIIFPDQGKDPHLIGFCENIGRTLFPPMQHLFRRKTAHQHMIVARTFIVNSIPHELLEASQIDGCSDIRYYLSIVLSLSKAIIAVLTLFYAVGHWNAYFNAMIYLHEKNLYPLTLFLREILMSTNIDPSTVSDPELQARLADLAAVIKYALIMVSVVPVLLIYPFVQKYFVTGVMIGSVKG